MIRRKVKEVIRRNALPGAQLVVGVSLSEKGGDLDIFRGPTHVTFAVPGPDFVTAVSANARGGKGRGTSKQKKKRD